MEEGCFAREQVTDTEEVREKEGQTERRTSVEGKDVAVARKGWKAYTSRGGVDTLDEARRRGEKKGRGFVYLARRVRKTSRMTIDQPRL